MRTGNRQEAAGNSKRTHGKSIFCFSIGALLMALCSSTEAQQLKRIPRIGYLANSPSVYPARIEAFRRGLRDLGYVEGKNVAIEWRFNQGNPDRIPALAAELVRLKVDIIVTTGALRTRAAKEATKTIPIVMAQEIDPGERVRGQPCTTWREHYWVVEPFCRN